MNKKAIICDMDGLLVDSETPFKNAWFSVSKLNGFEVNDALYLQLIGLNERDIKQTLLRHFNDEFPYDKIQSEIQIYMAQTHPKFDLKDGVLNLLESLTKNHVPRSVATSTSKEKALKRLEHSGILSYFDYVTAGDEVSNGKPSPDLFILAAERMRVKPDQCLVLEDSPSGALGAKRAGMNVILIPDLKQPPIEISNEVLGVFPSITNASPTIEKWLNS
jgi:HAD superfamily hydrolase (TIGR01509 family)